MNTSVKPAVHIVGWSHSKFGKYDQLDPETLIAEAVRGALADAGLSAEQVDAVVVGTFNGGFVGQDFPSSLALNAEPGLRFKPSLRVENACATGSAAIYTGMQAIRAGEADVVLVVGYERMNGLPTAQVGDVLLQCAYVKEESSSTGFAGVFAGIAQKYFDAYGDASDALAHISAKNHLNAMANPYAHVQRDLGFDFCNTVSEKNPIVAGPLRRTDCSLISDGAAALILCSEPALARGNFKRAVKFRAAQSANDYLPVSRRDILRLEGAQHAWQRAFAEAGCTLDDLSLVETHDCFTIAELLEVEAMGLAKPGQGPAVVREGQTLRGGRLPINLSGGLKAKGHPIGATGVSQHVLAAMQLVEEAGDMQLAGAQLAGVFNMGGVAVANYASILERSA
ncbi:acetyl-CoA acetyltransferase [Polaromonas sp.]|uniref:acetyl-CoA acetyltransferase n=1 Tax=Polaromonas sp. TaxID=1869339 RepID=UPI0017EC1FF3|nr:acetyl-CoA acetyltransferase [Polaromonas sp.]NML85326.1 acetyl-CoA acetyltransferase [Polaromonas sp.]